MARDPRYDILFEPVRIGPVVAPNRFFQVPHCNGMGYLRPNMLAAMRGIKAEGGWGVVCTEEVELHHTSDLSGAAEGRLWNNGDIGALKLMTQAVHEHGALAGIELVHNGFHAPNRLSRVAPLAPRGRSVSSYDPIHARTMDKTDIRNLRKWYREAALRAKQAEYDLIYVYAGHGMTLPFHFISRRTNDRTDEYGGSLENRVRLLRELLEETKETVGDRCAVALRFAVDELMGDDGITAESEGREVVEMLAELPDLWDVNVSNWANDSATSRFEKEGYQEPYISFVKGLTSKPVVGVGRYTSPDAMVSLVRRGVLDFIGAARPSIADPFLPQKIAEGRMEDIRECIGCNICASSDILAVPIRCTQNPTMGEEWRRGWHPEKIAPKGSDGSVLVVGAGPAGLECTRALAQRGYQVVLAEATTNLGGRVHLESRLPGLAEWGRVVDYRQVQIEKALNVEVYRGSQLTAADIREFGYEHVFLATGSRWRRDGMGRQHYRPIPGHDQSHVYSPDDVMAGNPLNGHVVIFDDDHYYMGGVLAEKLQLAGAQVTLITPASEVSTWTQNTLEQGRIQTRLMTLGVQIRAQTSLASIGAGQVELACVYTDRRETLACDHVLLVSDRVPNDSLYHDLMADEAALAVAGIKSVTRIGDCLAPGTIAAAVYSGHLEARQLDEAEIEGTPFRCERPTVFATDSLDVKFLELAQEPLGV